MRLTFRGANRQVTGSCYLLEAGGLNLLIDCGMFQERRFLHRNWEPFSFDPGEIDAVLLTHAHLDHCGLIPRLVKHGFTGPIYATEPSAELAQLVMEDSARLQLEDVKYKKKRHKKENRKSPHPYEPLYEPADAQLAGKLMRTVNYREQVTFGDGVSARWLDAGHILGSASVVVEVRTDSGSRRVVFSGDIGQKDRLIVADPTLIHEGDAAVMESTYGDRDHPPRDDMAAHLARVIHDTAERGGYVMIPTFAIERAQELLLHLAKLFDAGRIPRLPVFLDSPMAINATEIFRRHRDFMDDETRELLESGRLDEQWRQVHLTRTVEQSMAINDHKGPGIIMAGSGMCTGGRIKHHFAQRIGDPAHTILFVGYQSVGTLGRILVDGADRVRLFGVKRNVRAAVEKIDGLSAHADRKALLAWAHAIRDCGNRLFLTHGDEDAATNLAKELREQGCPDVDIPEFGEAVELTV